MYIIILNYDLCMCTYNIRYCSVYPSFVALHLLVSEVGSVYCFLKYIVYYSYYCGAFIEKHVYTKFCHCVHLPIVMYSLVLIYKSYIVY